MLDILKNLIDIENENYDAVIVYINSYFSRVYMFLADFLNLGTFQIVLVIFFASGVHSIHYTVHTVYSIQYKSQEWRDLYTIFRNSIHFNT